MKKNINKVNKRNACSSVFIRICLFAVLSVVVLFGTACSSNWKKIVSFSDLVFEESGSLNKIKAQMKNNTDRYYIYVLTIEARNGSIREDIDWAGKIKPNELKDIIVLTELGQEYEYSIKNVELTEQEIPNLPEPEGDEKIEIDLETLEYYFPDAYEVYSGLLIDTFLDLSVDLPESNDKVTKIYYEDDVITAQMTDELSDINMECYWLSGDFKMFILDYPNNIEPKYTSFVYNQAFGFDVLQQESVREIVKQHNGNTYSVSEWLISFTDSDGKIKGTFIRK